MPGILLLGPLAGCMSPAPTLEPLSLPVTLVDASFDAHRVALVLHTSCDEMTPTEDVSQVGCCLRADVHVADAGGLEIAIVQVDLPRRYRPGDPIQWEEATGGGGSGAGFVQPGLHEVSLPFYPLDEESPVAISVEVQTWDDHGQPLSSQRLGPAVLRLPPNDRGVARLTE